MIIGNRPTDRWENEVFKALKNQLPDDWIVMPSVMWTLKKNGYVRDGEADLVVLVPDSGLIIVEVKGSKEFIVGDDGIWRRKDNYGTWVRLQESPPEQATRNMHDLKDLLMKSKQWNDFPGRYSYLIVYPQGRAHSLPAMFDESTIATHQHMNLLATRLRNSLEKRGGTGRAALFTSQVIESIIDHLKNRKFHIEKVDTGEDVNQDMDKIEQLTRQQFATLQGLFQLPSVAVIGPAGSGKTVLAMWRLKALIDQGQKAIYVCYNKALAAFLRLQHSDHAKFIWNVDKLFFDIAPQSGGASTQSDFYRETLPSLVMDISELVEKYDTIIVDEGQDFSEEQIIALLDLVSSNGTWAFFADWKQDLYSAGKGAPIGAEVIFHLHYNCRNTQKINSASNHYLNLKIESMTGMPDGVPPLVELSSNQSMSAWKIAKQWSGEGSLVILSPYKYENSSMNGQKAGHGLRLSTNIDDLGKKDTVYFSTIKSFKGIEAESVIVVDLGIPDEQAAFAKEDLYVACTRATTRLALITSNEIVAKFYRELT